MKLIPTVILFLAPFLINSWRRTSVKAAIACLGDAKMLSFNLSSMGTWYHTTIEYLAMLQEFNHLPVAAGHYHHIGVQNGP